MYRKIASVLISSFIIVRFSIVTQGHLLWTQSILLSCVYVCVFYTSFFSSTLILTRSFVPYAYGWGGIDVSPIKIWYQRTNWNFSGATFKVFFWRKKDGLLFSLYVWHVAWSFWKSPGSREPAFAATVYSSSSANARAFVPL